MQLPKHEEAKAWEAKAHKEPTSVIIESHAKPLNNLATITQIARGVEHKAQVPMF